MSQPSEKSLGRVRKLVDAHTNKSGTTTHPNDEVREAVELGLAKNIDEIGRPLCPCRFYPDKQEEIKHRTWVCPCDDMQVYKYCHCLLFVKEDGNPITEYLPEGMMGLKSMVLSRIHLIWAEHLNIKQRREKSNVVRAVPDADRIT
ncbi:MAG: ferredoxin-thioredoxin reductase catalytic domain-containing protein [Bdellovibrionota bacterium]